MTHIDIEQSASAPSEDRMPAAAPLAGPLPAPVTNLRDEHPATRLARLFELALRLGLRRTTTMDGAARLLAVWRSRDPAAAAWVLVPMTRCADAVERLCRTAARRRPA
jgi:hypothetical protein